MSDIVSSVNGLNMNYLQEILDSEKESAQILETARKDAQNTETSAQEKNSEAISGTKDTSKNVLSSTLASQKPELAKLYQKTLNKESSKIDVLSASARVKLASAVRLVLDNI